MKALITQAALDKLRRTSGSAGKRAEIWDTALSSFYVQVRESGVASYYVRYLIPGTASRRSYLIGDAAVLSVADARAKAKKVLGQVAQGEDPSQEHKQLRDCPTLEQVVENYYIPHKAHMKSCRNDAGMFKHHVLPRLGKKKLCAIVPQEITDIQKRLLAAGRVPATANRPVVLLKHLFNLAMQVWKLPGVTSNPARAVRLLKEHSVREAYLSEQQIHDLLDACREQRSCRYLAPIVAFLLLTGARRMNVIEAQWCEIDEAAAQWTIPKTKSGRPQTIPLSPQALQILQALPSRGKSPYLFPSRNTGEPYKNIFNHWDRARRRAGLGSIRMHDLRHTHASILINAGCSLFVVQKALGHQNPQVTMRYAHLADRTLQDAASKVGNVVSPSLTGLVRQSR